MSARGLAVLDIDGTLTCHRSIWQYVMEQTGTWDVGLRNLEEYRGGRSTYQEFCDSDAAVFSGMDYAGLQSIAHEVPKPEGLDGLFTALASAGLDVALLSTGLNLLASYFTARYPVVECLVNDLESADGICTGRALVSVAEGSKTEHVRALIQDRRPRVVVAIGDSAGDLGMFEAADVAVALNASEPRVAARADRAFAFEEIGQVGAFLAARLR
jgi:HAD superfamily phosphoserine phosphatase-like hydrolase